MELKPQAPPRGPAHLSTFHRRCVFIVFAALLVSAALWLAFHYFIVADGPFGPERHPLEAWWLKLHGAAAMAALLVMGSLLPDHIRLGWLRRRNLESAIPLAGLLAFLVITGYGLYYAGDEDLRHWFSLTHWTAGIASGAVFLLHASHHKAKKRVRNPKLSPSRG